MNDTNEAPKKPVKHAGFLLFPGFALSSFSLAVEALSVVNKLNSENSLGHYQYQIYSAVEEATVVSSNQVPITTQGKLSSSTRLDILFICGYVDIAKFDCPELSQKINKRYHQGTSIASLTSGVFVLAKAKLLKGILVTLCEEHISTFKELYPDINVVDTLYSVDKKIYTCAGGMTALDMLLHIISEDLGSEMAARVSETFVIDRIRSEAESMASKRYLQLRMKSSVLAAAIELMEINIEQPLSIENIAHRVGCSVRNLEYIFKQHLRKSPTNYYLNLRLKYARDLVEQTKLPLIRIALATGFSSQSYFTKRFKQLFKTQPSEIRRTLRLLG